MLLQNVQPFGQRQEDMTLRFRNKIVRAIEKAFAKAAQSVRSSSGRKGTVSITKQLDYEAFRIPQSDLSVVTAHKALESIGYTSPITMFLMVALMQTGWRPMEYPQ